MEQGAVHKSGKVACTTAIAMTKGWRPVIGVERVTKYCHLHSGVGEWASDEPAVRKLLGGVTRVSNQANRPATA